MIHLACKCSPRRRQRVRCVCYREDLRMKQNIRHRPSVLARSLPDAPPLRSSHVFQNDRLFNIRCRSCGRHGGCRVRCAMWKFLLSLVLTSSCTISAQALSYGRLSDIPLLPDFPARYIGLQVSGRLDLVMVWCRLCLSFDN